MGHSAGITGLNFPFLCSARLWASVGLSECEPRALQMRAPLTAFLMESFTTCNYMAKIVNMGISEGCN